MEHLESCHPSIHPEEKVHKNEPLPLSTASPIFPRRNFFAVAQLMEKRNYNSKVISLIPMEHTNKLKKPLHPPFE